MNDFPAAQLDSNQAAGALTPGSPGSPLAEAQSNTGLAWSYLTSGSWPSANLAMFYPIVVRNPMTIIGAIWQNYGTLSNVDVGIYDRNGARLASLGSTAQTPASNNQQASLGPLAIAPGLYYLAFAADSTVAFMRITPSAALMQACGVQHMASAFPLPSTAVFANPAAAVAYAVAFGLRCAV